VLAGDDDASAVDVVAPTARLSTVMTMRRRIFSTLLQE